MLQGQKKSASSYPEMKAFFLKPNRSTVAIDCSDNRMAIRGLAIGLIVGIGVRVAHELGITFPAMFALNDAAAAIWMMLCDLWIASSELVKACFAS